MKVLTIFINLEKYWHYFVTNLVYEETNGERIECYMNIDVKENTDGNWFYSFAIEKGVAPQTLLAVVTENSATTPINSISENSENVNKNSENNLDERFSKSKRNGFTIARETAMRIAEELVKDYDDGTVTAKSAEKRLKAIGFVTDVNESTALDILDNHLVEKFYGQEFILSDGKKAIMDKRDAKELSHLADETKMASIVRLYKMSFSLIPYDTSVSIPYCNKLQIPYTLCVITYNATH